MERENLKMDLGETVQDMLGLLRIRVNKGVNLAVRDVGVSSSDPYVVVKMGKQRLKTRVIKKDVNPEWNDDLTLPIIDPKCPVILSVYDHDMFTLDDGMGDAEIDIKPFLNAVRMKLGEREPDNTVLSTVHPERHNCLSEDSQVIWKDGHIIQDMCLRLRHVESGEVYIQLQWIDLPNYSRHRS